MVRFFTFMSGGTLSGSWSDSGGGAETTDVRKIAGLSLSATSVRFCATDENDTNVFAALNAAAPTDTSTQSPLAGEPSANRLTSVTSPVRTFFIYA